ncbi:MAG TPA: aminotransferase class V-fold PLP-dependent enzyme, partial [Gemmatimonadales bacterium]|nr:aminotransferase class V-fold PLP-dependent enzyme [Gemmatimonadales bacterium]
MPDRIHNFGAGPGVLPEPVLRQTQQDLWNIGGSGIGIAEHSHRGKVFEKVIAEAEESARRLANIPDNYRVLFIQGGATQQFAMVPMNLLPGGRTADYLITGVWAEKALQEALKFGTTHVALSGQASKFTRIPDVSDIQYSERPAYV